MDTKTEKQPAPAPGFDSTPPKPAGVNLQFQVGPFIEAMRKLIADHGARGAMLALLWPVALFVTLIALTLIIVMSGSVWPLCAFVLPLAALLLFAGPRTPGKKE